MIQKLRSAISEDGALMHTPYITKGFIVMKTINRDFVCVLSKN